MAKTTQKKQPRGRPKDTVERDHRIEVWLSEEDWKTLQRLRADIAIESGATCSTSSAVRLSIRALGQIRL